MAEKLHKSQPAYAQMENGTTKVDFDQLIELANIFEVDLEELAQAENGKTFNFNNNKIQKQDFIEHYYSGIKDAYVQNIKLMKEAYDETIKSLKGEISYLRSMLGNK